MSHSAKRPGGSGWQRGTRRPALWSCPPAPGTQPACQPDICRSPVGKDLAEKLLAVMYVRPARLGRPIHRPPGKAAPVPPVLHSFCHKDGEPPRGHLCWRESSRTGVQCSWICLLTDCVNDTPSVLVSCGCHSKEPQAWWLQTTELDPLPVLEVRSPKSKCQQGPLRAPG